MAHSYDVGTKAWQPDPTEGWVASEVISKTADGDKVKLVFELANGEVCPNSSKSYKVFHRGSIIANI
jgi:myosin heavy subunit